MDAWGDRTTQAALRVAVNMLEGELAAADGNLADAIVHIEEAVAIYDGIGYYEPPVWYSMPRQTLGALLLEDGRAAEAEAAYRADLEEWPENGWSLFGLYRALEAQGQNDEAQVVRRRFNDAWSRRRHRIDQLTDVAARRGEATL